MDELKRPVKAAVEKLLPSATDDASSFDERMKVLSICARIIESIVPRQTQVRHVHEGPVASKLDDGGGS